MSQPVASTTGNDATTRDTSLSEPITFTLVIVSPSVGVSAPLSFPNLDAGTTVKELKAKIRESLPAKPSDERQRLIHRGRMLAKESETMLTIFGAETLRTSESQTLHLVLRPAGSDAPTTTEPPQSAAQPATRQPLGNHASPGPGSIHAPGPMSAFPNHLQHLQQLQQLQQLSQQQQQAAQRAQVTNMSHQLQHMQREAERLNEQLGDNRANVVQRLHQLARDTERIRAQISDVERLHLQYTQPLNNGSVGSGLPSPPLIPQQQRRWASPAIPPPPAFGQSIQELIAQQQQARAALGRNGVQDTSGTNAIPSGTSTPTRRPDHTTTYTREGVGPNGERWQVTVNETTTTIPTIQARQHHVHSHYPGRNPVQEMQALLSNADRLLATQNELNRRHSNSTQNSASTQTTSTPETAEAPASDRPTTATVPSPSLANTPVQSIPQTNLTVPASNASVSVPSTSTGELTSIEPMVYILSSPTGPRALLINNSQSFFTPRLNTSSTARFTTDPAQIHALNQDRDAVGFPEFRNRVARRDARRGQRHQENAPAVLPLAHGNPGAGAAAAHLWPAIWLIVRLIAFVWFFTAGNPSWSRFFLMTGLAVVVFVVNTGVLNGVAEIVWGPIRRHIETLLPLAGPEAALVPAANAVIPQQAPLAETPRRRGELDPAEVAAHLIEQRRNQPSWLVTQFRRVEHAMFLFIASLVPGVGERHIAAREAEATAAEAERQRRIDAENAAEPADADGEGEQQTERTTIDAENGENQEQGENVQGEAELPAAQPLIEV